MKFRRDNVTATDGDKAENVSTTNRIHVGENSRNGFSGEERHGCFSSFQSENEDVQAWKLLESCVWP
ncbi:hypothetical protein ACOSQ2_000593 [Xanthoceras sorbifolium]